MRSSFLVGLGNGFTAFLVVAIAVIELIEVDPGAGILGVILGVFGGILVFVAVVIRFGELGVNTRCLLYSGAGFGYAVMLVQVVSYVNVLGLRSIITTYLTVVFALVVSVIMFLAFWVKE